MSQTTIAPPTFEEALADPRISNIIAGRYAAKTTFAVKDNHKFEIGLLDYSKILLTPTCGYTDLPLALKKVTLERVNPLKEYTVENTIAVSEAANELKGVIFDKPLRSHGSNNFNKFLADSLKVLSRVAKHEGFELTINDKGDFAINKPVEGVRRVRVGDRVKITSPRSAYKELEGKVLLITFDGNDPVYHVHLPNINPPGLPPRAASAKVKQVETVK